MQPTSIEEFMAIPELKYAVITKSSWEQDPVAQSLSANPREFTHEGAELVILSVSKFKLPDLVAYVDGNVEFELTLGTGKVTLLSHSVAESLLAGTNSL